MPELLPPSEMTEPPGMRFARLVAAAVLAVLQSVDIAVVAKVAGFGTAEAGSGVDNQCTELEAGEGLAVAAQLVDSQCIEAAPPQLHSPWIEVQIHSAEVAAAAAAAEVEPHIEIADRTEEALGARCSRHPGKNWSLRTWLFSKMLKQNRQIEIGKISSLSDIQDNAEELAKRSRETTNPVLAYATA